MAMAIFGKIDDKISKAIRYLLGGPNLGIIDQLSCSFDTSRKKG